MIGVKYRPKNVFWKTSKEDQDIAFEQSFCHGKVAFNRVKQIQLAHVTSINSYQPPLNL
ncbi:hypothetical protein H6F93_32285 [Leptolyngbya sp. FACHB-671]|nr:hypothetical protein [Leptolyngbya sp. FACHB-671]